VRRDLTTLLLQRMWAVSPVVVSGRSLLAPCLLGEGGKKGKGPPEMEMDHLGGQTFIGERGGI